MSPIRQMIRRVPLGGIWLVLPMIVAAGTPARGMLSAGDAYCAALGYESIIALTKKGEQGLCRLPDGRLVDALSFLNGRVGLDASYCATQGLQAKHVEDPKVCRSCTVCVMLDGSEKRVVELMGLDLRETTCGDEKCLVAENADNCPADCPSGGSDEFCDGRNDGICDPDCAEAELPDPDCVGCPGDCNGDRAVAVNELIRGVNIALGRLQLTECLPLDRDANGKVTVNELVLAVGHALIGCS